jgi:hypothetical protein
MARFYHVDREVRHLRQGYRLVLKTFASVDQTEGVAYINGLYPNGVSRFGASYISGLVPDHQRVLVKREIICEEIRLTDYPHRPSRFASVFACENLADAQELRETFGSPNAIIWVVECENSFRADMHHLQVGSLQELPKAVHRYWNGESGGAPFWECLLSPPVTVLEMVG